MWINWLISARFLKLASFFSNYSTFLLTNDNNATCLVLNSLYDSAKFNLFWTQSSPLRFSKPLKNEAAELLRVAQSNSFDLLKPSNSSAYREIAAFCLLFRYLLAFLDTSAKFTSNSRILGIICSVSNLSKSAIFFELVVSSFIYLKKPLYI